MKRNEGIGIEIFYVFSHSEQNIACTQRKYTPSGFSSDFLASDVEIFHALI